MNNPENIKPTIDDEVKPGLHTSAELEKIRNDFGPGADIALKSIYKRIGYKVTSHRGHSHTKPVDQ